MAEKTERKGDWMQTVSGVAYYPFDPRVVDVRTTDIRHALSHVCRYGGHCKRFYSVLEHSILVAEWLELQGYDRRVVFEGLCHDFTEAYLIDMPQPIKRDLQQYRDLEDLNWQVIADKYGLPFNLDPAVKQSDMQVLMAEKPILLGKSPMKWGYQNIEPAKVKIHAHWPMTARWRFTRAFNRLAPPALRI